MSSTGRPFRLSLTLAAAAAPDLAGAEGSAIDPRGPIARAELAVLQDTALLVAPVLLVVFVLLAVALWRFRAGGRGAYRPDWDGSRPVEAVVWGGPALIVAAIAALVITSTRALDLARPLAGRAEAMTVQVISLDWAYLFVYPQEGIASVGVLAFPADRPLDLRMTSDATMSSFVVPALGGQVYAMAGMVTRLELAADAPVETVGRNALYNGDGFVAQRVAVRALAPDAHAAWIETARAAAPLTPAVYAALASEGRPAPRLFGAVPDGFFDDVVARYASAPKAVQAPRHP